MTPTPLVAVPLTLPAWAEMPVVCAWCKPGPPEYRPTSHGICDEHAKEMLR
jgi:hypothetical protein